MGNNILLEEINRIHEIMGLNPQKLLLEADIKSYMFDFTEDFFRTIGFKSEKEIDEAFKLVDEFERLSNPRQKAEFTNRLSDNQKKMMDAAQELKKGVNVTRDDLIELLKAGSNRDQAMASKIDSFAETIFNTPGLKEIAIESFKKQNPTAKGWDALLTKNIKDFDSRQQINVWADGKIQIIDESDIPDYIKKYYIDLINKNREKLSGAYQGWINFIKSDEYRNIIRSIKDKDTQTKFGNVSKKYYEDAMKEGGNIEKLIPDLIETAKILNTSVQNWTKEDVTKVVKRIMKGLETDELMTIEALVRDYKKNLAQESHQNPTWFSKLCRDTWKNKTETEKSSDLNAAIAVIFRGGEVKDYIMKYKWGRCALLPLFVVTASISLLYGISGWASLNKVDVGLAEPVEVFFGAFPPETQQKYIDKLFPNLRFLTYPVSINREAFFQLFDEVDELDNEKKAEEPLIGVLRISLNGTSYSIKCKDWKEGNEKKEDPSNWILISDDRTQYPLPNYADKYISQNEFTAYANEQSKDTNSSIFKLLPVFTIKNYAVVSTTPDVVTTYNKKQTENVFEFKKQEDGSWKSTQPAIEDFYKWIISDAGTKEGWGPTKETLIDIDGSAEYNISIGQNQYFITDTKDPNYKEIYEYDKQKNTFKFIK